MIIVDLETRGFQVEDGIFEVAVLVVENDVIVDELHLGKVCDVELIYDGMGEGYEDISVNDKYRNSFKYIIEKYNYPIIAHNASFDRKFLVYYNWLPEDYPVYDSVRALRIEHPHLFSYSMSFVSNYFNVDQRHSHTALGDVFALYNVIKKANPKTWIPLFKPLPSQFKSKAKNLLERGMQLQGESSAFEGKHLVFTGASQFPRVLMQEIAVACGASVGNSVIKKTDYLICGEKVGQSKIDRANELEIPLYTDEWFIDIVFNDINLEQADNIVKDDSKSTFNRKIMNDSYIESPYKQLPEFYGKKVNVACLKASVQKRVIKILEDMGASVNKSPSGKNVDYMIYTDDGDYVMLKRAEEFNIKLIAASSFNRMLLE
ncbi:hypothetical protein CSV80_12465 [Sporosarcina sp. P12(2017)]|uniref:BRCT domain-containing protein n=1 Tax=unclassified Sporosarcina TaxID=2647733 RepID=UPI000C16D33D|nr:MULTISPECIES: BRCT domain-containing protein [unclassified Sporosarcina]PIC56577.1 hypothetical protein CSV81_14075 [Sporosarcina sp. P10]PIC60228.1 hypothetical protein CSV80_12465 [Sporosarcina sp. P12(2017)]